MKHSNTIRIGNFYFKKTVVRWTVSYISILLAISIIFGIVYYKMELILDEHLSQYGVEWMDNRKNTTDQILRMFYKLTLELSYDKSIQDIEKYEEYHLQENRFSILSLQNRLKSYHLADEYIESLFIYFPRSNYTISTSYSGKFNNFFQIYFSQTGASYDRLLSLITLPRFDGLLPIPYLDSEDKKDLLYVKPILTPDNETLCATICIKVSSSAFSYENLGLSKDDIFFILDNQNKVLFSSDTISNTERITAIVANDSSSYVEKRFDNYVLFQSLSEELPLKYVYLTNREIFFSALKNFRSVVLTGMSVALLIGTFLTIYISNRNYLPVRNLIGYAKESLKLPEKQFAGNEFGQIRTVLEEMVQKNKVLAKRNETNDIFLKNTKLSDFLRRGNKTEAEITDILLSLGISLRYGFYMVTLYMFDDLSEIFFETQQQDSAENYSLAKLILTNILNEYYAAFCESYNLETDGLLCIILNIERSDDAAQVAEVISKTRQFVLENFNINFSGMISDAHQNVRSLPTCYAEALSCIGYPSNNDNKILLYSELKGTEKTKYYYSLEQEVQILNCLSAGNRQRCAELINNIFDSNEAKILPPNMMKCLLYDMLGTLAKSKLIDIDTIDKVIKDCMNNMMNAWIFKEEILKIFDDVCLMQYNQNIESFSIEKKAKDFAKANYSDPSLTVEQIARHIPINKSYLSLLFKRTTGMGILEYITLLRIEEGKRLLTDTSKSLDEIITAVGYNSIPAFSRVFKKSVGVTPVKFRLINSNLKL